MMKQTGKAFVRKLFGARYERLPRTLLVDVIVFWGLYIAGFRVQIAPAVRSFMISAFTAGVMWQALSSKDNAVEMRHMLMLPYRRAEFVFSYVAVLGAYTILTKTGLLLAVVLAVSSPTPVEIAGAAVCMIHAVLMTAVVYFLKKYRCAGVLITAGIAVFILFFGNRPWMSLVLSVNSLSAVLMLRRADGYDFYPWESRKNHGNVSRAAGQRKTASLRRYFFRYLSCHKNYLLNTVVMWCVALVLPYFLGDVDGLSVIPIGFAMLSFNTPVCILLSCDRDLEQAVRFLPGQKRRFCIPYGLFLFLCNMAADAVYLFSWQITNGGVTVLFITEAVFFALQSAVLSVLLEWFYPIQNWKIESDLWHHPRKYIVPGVMMLIAGAALVWPVILPVLLVLSAAELVVLFFLCQR